MGIYTEIQLSYSFVLHLQIRTSPKNKFELCSVHLNPHAKCRSSKFDLKLFKKKKKRGSLKTWKRISTKINTFTFYKGGEGGNSPQKK